MYRNVRVYVTPIFMHIEKEKRNFCREISKFVWKVTNSHHCLRLFLGWRRSFLMISRAIKGFIRVRKARIELLTLIFNKYSAQIPKKDRRVSLTLTPNSKSNPNSKKIVIDYLAFYLHRQAKLNSPFQLYSDKKAQQDFIARLGFNQPKRVSTSFN